VAFAEDVTPGRIKHVQAGNTEVALVNLNGEIFAIGDICSHAHCNLSSGYLEGDVVICPCHGAGFDPRSGAVLEPPARHNLAVYPVRVEGDLVLVAIP
jgi:nitrite reductase/ring-hydroxylating ferredoxin subunit